MEKEDKKEPVLPPSLIGKYTAIRKAHEWELWCKECERGWVLKYPQPGEDVSIGSILHLLNHAASHGE